MRISILLFASFTILVAAPSPSGAEQPSESIDAFSPASRAKTCGESFSRDSTEEFNKNCVALAGPRAAMRGGTLVLRMDNGSRKIFDNKNGVGALEGGGFGYGLADFYPSTHVFVVCDYGPDAGHFKAIDGKTGRELDFGYASPQFSPDGNWVLAVEYNDDGMDSSFAIFDVRGDKQLTVWTSKASKTRLPAKAKFVAWTDNKTIKFTSPGKKSVFLTSAPDGTWGVNTAPN
ncbi:hypothetical protein V1291_000322 [Nitrobacteraceae bacterium AZCC 1564]